MTARLIVIGGGLAGIAAAVRLAEAGRRPLLIETRKGLGGRASSFVDPRSDLVLDNCQHVVLGCCTNLLDLYDRIGVLDKIIWSSEMHWSSGGGMVHTIRPGPLPAPAHYLCAMTRLEFLSKEDRRSIRRAMWRLLRLGPRARLLWSGKPFSAFLGELQQPLSAVERFWNIIITSACNLDCARVDAGHAIHVFQEGFLSNRWGSSIGLPATPLSRLYDPAIELIEGQGGDVVEGVAAKSLAYDGRRVTAVVTSDGALPASSVVSAIPFDRLDKLLSDTLRRADSRLQRLDQFGFSPILGVHLWFEREVMTLPHMIAVDAGVQWIFNKGIGDDGRQHLHAVISAADVWMPRHEQEIVPLVLDDIHRLLPASRGLEPVQARTVKEKRATFAAVPGVDSLRPRATAGGIGLGGGVPNLYIAGDWCDTGWPATMEGAVRSGYAAAEAITGEGGVVADLPPALLARLLGMRGGAS